MTLGLTNLTRILHGFVWPIKIRKIRISKNPREVKNSTNEYFKKKHKTLLTDIGGKCFMNQINNPKPSIKIPRFTKNKKRTI